MSNQELGQVHIAEETLTREQRAKLASLREEMSRIMARAPDEGTRRRVLSEYQRKFLESLAAGGR
jgi:hypothetical protein